ncbi:unnamed protein product [Mytilus coruscus]|uniref:Integrase zinc-binding domain-containing protein n=1 Tax=Mytilus coruscus TaxID=42192 RepID=A0A6J8CUV4_MYTCO|nr:unnamed protein product [Mytilus coruscus]
MVTLCHLDIRKTIYILKDRFYWTGIRHKAVTYLASCKVCAKRKDPNKRQGALRQLEKKPKYIFVKSDYYSKWTKSLTIPNMLASTAANILVTEVITRFGVSTAVHSDQKAPAREQFFFMQFVIYYRSTRLEPRPRICSGTELSRDLLAPWQKCYPVMLINTFQTRIGYCHTL